MKKNLRKAIKWVQDNISRFPQESFSDYDLGGRSRREVIWLLDSEDGTAADYETSRQRLGVRKDGRIVWGFTSGCSCWFGWTMQEYSNATYKEFVLKDIETYDSSKGYYSGPSGIAFSDEWEKELLERVKLLKDKMKGEF